MKQNYVLLSAIVAASTFNVLAAQPAPVIDVSSPAGVSAPVNELTEQLANIERMLDLRNRSQITMQKQLNDLQMEIDELRGITELHDHKLSQILERQRELYQELDKRVNEAIKTPAPTASAPVSQPSLIPTLDYSNDLSENEAYDHAVNLVLKEKQYEQAITEFVNFNKKYPNSSYAANAHYWLGQLLFNKNDLAGATKEFTTVVNEHKSSSKRSDALLKLATVAQKKNDDVSAKNLYQQLIQEYPNSSAARLAEPRLQAILQP